MIGMEVIPGQFGELAVGILKAATESAIDAAFAALLQLHADALVVACILRTSTVSCAQELI